MRAKFADTLKIINGKNQQKVEDLQGRYPIYGSGGIMGYANDYICPAETVIIGRKGSINKPIFADTPFWNVDTAFGLCADKAKLFPKYLYYFCVNFDFERLNTTVTIPSLTKSNLLNIEIPLPPLDEQRRIAAVLDKVSNLITKRREQLDKLDELVKARFVEMFGDPINNTKGLPTIPLGKVCNLKAGVTTSSDEIHSQSEEYSVPCYGGNGIRGFVKKATQNGTYPIIGRQGALCGNVQLATGEFHATEHAVLVSPLIEVNVFWIYHLLKFMDLYRYHTGAAQPGLAVKVLNSVQVPIADINQQNEFAMVSECINKSKLTIQQSLDKIETLKKALMQEYFG